MSDSFERLKSEVDDMASIDFQKCHGGREVKPILRHCELKERLKNKHKNKDIDKSRTENNFQILPKDCETYDDVARAYDETISWMDSMPGQNKRRDRVTAVKIEIPAPPLLPSDNATFEEWARKVVDIVLKEYGLDKDSTWFLGAYGHVDEVHDYRDSKTGQMRTSRNHLHMMIIPAVEKEVLNDEGEKVNIPSLNGKWFTSKMHINHLNDAIDKMTRDDYGVGFMTGEKSKSKKTINELKSESEVLKKFVNKVNALEKDQFDADFIDFLSKKQLKNGQTRAEQLQRWQKEYAEYVKDKVTDEVSTEMAAEVEAEKEPVPVNKPRKMPKKAPKVREVPVDTPTQQKSNFDRQMDFILQSRASMNKKSDENDGLG